MPRAFSIVLVLLLPIAVEAQIPNFTGKPILELGVLDTPTEQVFGKLQAVDVDSNGNIFILDSQAHQIRWFDKSGQFRGQAGRQGQGPGELRYPYDLKVDERGWVQVLDPGNLRISLYEPTLEGLVHRGDQRTVFARDMCIAKHRRFLGYPRDEGPVQEIDSTGAWVRSIGELEPPDPAGLNTVDHLNAGPIACDPSGRVVIVTDQGVVKAYAPSGVLSWRVELPDFYRIHWVPVVGEGGSRGARWGPDPKSGTTHNVTAAFIHEEHIFITLTESGMKMPEGRFETRVLRLIDGREVQRIAVPETVISVKGGRAYMTRTDPFPQVVVR